MQFETFCDSNVLVAGPVANEGLCRLVATSRCPPYLDARLLRMRHAVVTRLPFSGVDKALADPAAWGAPNLQLANNYRGSPTDYLHHWFSLTRILPIFVAYLGKRLTSITTHVFCTNC